MNQSKLWTVYHEPAPKIEVLKTELAYKKHLNAAQMVLNKDYYGEVNSMRRRIAHDLKVTKCGVLIRHPAELLLSAFNRKGVHHQWLNELGESLKLVDHLVTKGWPVIWFNEMTTDVEYTQNILKYYGINDVEVTEETLAEKVNKTTSRKFRSLADKGIPNYILEDYHTKSQWFVKKHIKKKKLGNWFKAETPKKVIEKPGGKK